MLQDNKLGEEEREEERRVAAKYAEKEVGKGETRAVGPTDTAGVHSNRRRRALATTGVL